MRADQSTVKVLAFMQSVADADGLVWGIAHNVITRETGVSDGTVRYAISCLIKAGAITQLVIGQGRQKAMYRINSSVPPPEPVRKYAPHGIEAVTRSIANRNYTGTGDNLPMIEISVARVRFLEERA